MTSESSTSIQSSFEEINSEAGEYFRLVGIAIKALRGEQEEDKYDFDFLSTAKLWSGLPGELQEKAGELGRKLLPLCATLGELSRTSALTGSEDTQEIKVATKSLLAALRLRKYRYQGLDVIHDEGYVLGVKPADQSEEDFSSTSDARDEFFSKLSALVFLGNLVNASPFQHSAPEMIDVGAKKYVANSAFIMMWMDSTKSELEDLVDTVRGVFRNFKINAVRADDIEHEGLITDQVLNHIRTSEFLFADLTGTRPNVYYEIGFAHALGKRVILFRKSGTGIHFDLAGYNCPEYENFKDLREKLTKRLVNLTNRNPSE